MAGPLSHSPAEINAELLRQWDVPSTPWVYYDSNEPDASAVGDEIVTMYDTEGMEDGRAMIDGELWNHWGIQARIRSSEHTDGWLHANAIRNFWATQINQAVVAMKDKDGNLDGSRYLIWCIAHIGPVLALGKNVPNTKRSIFTVNAISAIRELTAPTT